MMSKNSWALIFGVGVSLLAFYFALSNVDIDSLVGSITSIDPAWTILVLLSYMLHFWLKALRWRDLLAPICQPGTPEVHSVMMTGFLANNILPAHLGEFVRMYIGSKQFKAGNTEVFATIVLERAFDFSAIAVMFGGALIFGGAIPDQLVIVGYMVILATAFAWIVVFLVLRYETPAIRSIGWLLSPLPARIERHLIRMLLSAISAIGAMKSGYLVLRCSITSFLQWGLVGVAIYAALNSVGVEASVASTVITLVGTVLAVTLPAAPGFFGTIQLAFVLALLPYGVKESDALAASFIFHMVTYCYVMLSGLLALNHLNMRVADLPREMHRL
jgi:uncharacterized protein (TIRG00374 family)